jgi:hypothetical protein
VFLPLGMPLGDVEWLDASFAAVYMVGVLFVLFRYGLVAATVGLTVNAVLQSTPFHGTATALVGPGHRAAIGHGHRRSRVGVVHGARSARFQVAARSRAGRLTRGARLARLRAARL